MPDYRMGDSPFMRFFGEPSRLVKGDLDNRSRWGTLEDLYSSEQSTNADLAISWGQEELKKHSACPAWEKLNAMISLFRYVPALGHHFAILRHVVAEDFFRMFPEGEIWHVKVHRHYGEISQKKKASIVERYGPSGEGHSSSGLEIGSALLSAGMSIPLSMTFPYVWGAKALTVGGVAIFLPNQPLNTWLQALDPTRILQTDAAEIYEGTAQGAIGIGVKISNFLDEDGASFVSDNFKSYLLWYLERLDFLYEFINEVEPEEDAYLLSLSVSRILYETLIAVTTHMAFTRNQFLYAILDKYANISKGLALCPSPMSETEVWKTFLSAENLRNRIAPIVGTIRGLGRFLAVQVRLQQSG
jgi:hypothetical protein